MSQALPTLLSAAGPLSIGVSLVVVGLLSQRLGAVTKMHGHYRWFFVAAAFVGFSALIRLLQVNAGEDSTLSLIYSATFALGITIGVVAAWYYWSWLFGERGR